jgi:hypothetical protein
MREVAETKTTQLTSKTGRKCFFFHFFPQLRPEK